MSRLKRGKMNNFIRFGFLTLIFALVLSVSLNYLSDMTYACEVRDNGYGLQVKYEKAHGRHNKGVLFNVDNMAPGEEYTEVITVKNTRTDSFKTLLSAVNTSKKDNLLFNSLDFTIHEESANGTVIYNGKLKDLNNAFLCSLSAKKNKTYYLTLSLPAESDNRYQKKSSGFKFVITAVANTVVQGGRTTDDKDNKKSRP